MKKILALVVPLFLLLSLFPVSNSSSYYVVILLPDYSEVFEGDRIPCDISLPNATFLWRLNDSHDVGDFHSTFVDDDPVLINVEQFKDRYVTLTVFADNGEVNISSSVKIELFKVYFGDTHMHSKTGTQESIVSTIDQMLENASNYKQQGYWWALDFVCDMAHQEGRYMADKRTDGEGEPKGSWTNSTYYDNYYYSPGTFTVMCGGEYSGTFADIGHLTTFFSGDASEVPDDNLLVRPTIETTSIPVTSPNITDSWEDAKNLCWWIVNHTSQDYLLYPHHVGYISTAFHMDDVWDWSQPFRDRFVRGMEVVQKQRCNLDKYTNGINHITAKADTYGGVTDSGEWAAWKWASKTTGYKNRIFTFIGGSDHHPRAGVTAENIGKKENYNIGRCAVFAKYNNRSEIFSAFKEGRVYALDYQNLIVSAKIDGKHFHGQWIEVSENAKIEITAYARSNPTNNSSKLLITDIYIIKLNGSSPSFQNATVIEHITNGTAGLPSNWIHYETTVTASEQDVFWIAVRAWNASDNGRTHHGGIPCNPYRAWTSPVFIDNITSEKPRLLFCNSQPYDSNPSFTDSNITFTWTWDSISPVSWKLWVYSTDGSFNYTVNISHSQYARDEYIEYTWGSQGEPALPPGQYRWRVKCIYGGGT